MPSTLIMADSNVCFSHVLRIDRGNLITKILVQAQQPTDENLKVLIKRGPVSLETSLKELEENYKRMPEWKMILDGGVLSVPVEEFRMENLPKPDRSGKVVFKEMSGGRGKYIENYPVGQTIENLNDEIRDKYEAEKQKAEAAGKGVSEAEKKGFAASTKLPQFRAVKAWQDTKAEIKLKKALERMMVSLKIPTVLIRSIDMKQISDLNDLGLKLPGDAKIDLAMVYSSGNLLHVNVFDVNRKDAFPWDTKSRPPNKQTVNRAENKLTLDVHILMGLLADTPPDQIVFHTLACYPDSSIAELQTIFCDVCLEQGVICQEDLNDLSLLQKKTKVPDKRDPTS